MPRSDESDGCKLCNSKTARFGEATVLKKYAVSYYRCANCGFIQTESPYWLSEAYSSAIASQDVGIMQRNSMNCEITSAVLSVFFSNSSRALDFGAGHGIFVRMMRDRGFNFFWSDLHAANTYARGFECGENERFDFLTAFEVLEHLVDPLTGIAELMSKSNNVLVSTCPLPEPAPNIGEWWYYMPRSGQHISFYSIQSLRLIASRFDRYLLSAGPYHLFTKEPRNAHLFKLVTRLKGARMANVVFRRKSLITADFDSLCA